MDGVKNQIQFHAAFYCLLISAVFIRASETPEPSELCCPVEPYVKISVLTHFVDLGIVQEPGIYDSSAVIKVRIEIYHCRASMSVQSEPLEGDAGAMIEPERIFVKVPATGEYIPTAVPADITGPLGPGNYKFDLNFRVNTVIQDPAGTYSGTIIFTCSGCP